MDALASHFSISGSRGAVAARALSPPSISSVRFLQTPAKKVPLAHPISLDAKPIRSVSPSLSLSPHQADANTIDSQTDNPHHSKTVHVKFVLHKACLFGQQFLIVGDDPMFGFWDPVNAIPLEWSEGHIWAVALDIPVGKSIQFKFILRGKSGEVYWQPGPDRCLKVWGTPNTIVVSEDWDKADEQKIMEEDPANVTTPVVSTENEIGGNGSALIVDAVDGVMGGNGSRDGDPILVPGLAPTSGAASDSVFPKGIVHSEAFDSLGLSVEAEESSSVQLAEPQEETELANGNDPLDSDCREESPSSGDAPLQAERNLEELTNPQTTADALKNDFQWGHQTLRRFLLNLGFTIDSPPA